MPGPDAVYDEGEDRYPATADAHTKILGWCLDSFQEAERHRQGLTKRWRRYELLYRMHVERRTNDWRSKVFLPIVFYVVETILPRMLAQLPEMVVKGVEEQDDEPARLMEQLLRWAAKRSGLQLELVKAYKSALKFGTGILKVYHAREVITRKVRVPEMAPVMQTLETPVIDPETGMPARDLDGVEMFEAIEEPQVDPMTGEPMEEPTGKEVWTTEEVVRYDGPKAEAVDIFNFWFAPEASSIEDSRYVIQRVFRDTKYVEDMLLAGTYRLPDGMTFKDATSGEHDERRQIESDLDLGGSEHVRKSAEILEIWTDDTQYTVLNRTAVVRVADNPFEHGRKPYVRIVDHFQEHSPWGVGEIEPLEGLQDEINALTNQRIDNVRLSIDQMFVYDPNMIPNKEDLVTRPGGGIRANSNDIPPNQVIYWLQTPDVTANAYNEVSEAERMTEKVSGVNSYTAGGDADAGQINQTATGASIIAETGNTRFAAKVEMAELTGLNPLAEMYGSILQQWAEDEMVIRIAGEYGAEQWVSITAEGIQGGFDYEIESQSSAVTESIRKEQSMSLLNLGSQIVRVDGSPVFNVDALAEDVLVAWKVTNRQKYLLPPPPPPMVDPTTGAPMDPAMAEQPALPPTPTPEAPPLEAVQ
jgi:hypothetical protein